MPCRSLNCFLETSTSVSALLPCSEGKSEESVCHVSDRAPLPHSLSHLRGLLLAEKVIIELQTADVCLPERSRKQENTEKPTIWIMIR